MTRSLRRFLREPDGPQAPPQERCELCATPVAAEHPHLVEPAERRLLCACTPCGVLFSEPGLRYRRVPDRYLYDTEFVLSDSQWDELQVPVGMAFFLVNSIRRAVVACYPSPAGATESLLPRNSWDRRAPKNPEVERFEPDVQALLVNRVGLAREYYLAPIDQCFELVGLIRANWRGFSGGQDAWRKINGFFARMKESARSLETHA